MLPAPRRTTRKNVKPSTNSTLPASKQQPDEPVPETRSKRGQVRKRKDNTDASASGIPPTTSKRARTTAPDLPTEPDRPIDEGIVAQPAARRSSRVPQHLAPAQKRKRRTPAEMAAAREEAAAKKALAEKSKKRLEEIAAEADRRLEMMDLDEAANKAATNAKIVRRLSDMVVDQEDGEFIAIDDVSSTDEDECSDSETLQKKSYEQLEAELNELRMQVGGQKRRGGNKTKMVAYASGLLPDGNKEASNKALRKNSKAASRYIEVKEINGGLDDSDAEAVEIFEQNMSATEQTMLLKASKRDLSRQNELVTEIMSDNDELTPSLPPKLRARPSKHVPTTKPRIKVSAKPIPKDLTIPAPAAASRQPKAKTLPAPTKRLTSNNVRIADLPDFAHKDNAWRQVFLPTLFDRFFAGDMPFFIKGTKSFIEFVQCTVDLVFPDVEYDVHSKCPIHFIAYNRINDKRSAIGLEALEVVSCHIEALSGKKEIANWLNHALRADGPLYFETPSPLGSPTDRKNPNYIQPSGRLLSPFILKIIRTFLALNSNSISAYRHPRTLCALIIAALERATEAFRDGKVDSIGEFSNELWGSRVLTAYSNLGKISDERWEEVLAACHRAPDPPCEESKDDIQADLSLLDNDRGVMFNFNSPAKA